MKFYKLIFLTFMFILAYHHAKMIYIIFFQDRAKPEGKKAAKEEVSPAAKPAENYEQDAISALRKLGFSQKRIILALDTINDEGASRTLEETITRALRIMTSRK